jgi:ATP-binding cassette subfamily B protein
MIEASVELFIPFVMASVLSGNDKQFYTRMTLIMLAIVVLGSALATLGQYFSARAAAAVSHKMREDIYEKINSLEFYDIDKIGTASLINRLTADVNSIQNAVLIFVRIALRAPFLIAGSILFAMLIDGGIALIIVACLPFLAASFYIITKRLVPKYTEIQKILDAVTLETKEDLEGIRVVRAFNKREREITEFKGYTQKHASMSVQAGKMSAGLGPINTFIINVGVIAIVYFVGMAVNATPPRFEVANISAFITYMVQIVTALNMITTLTLNIVKAAASNKRVKEIFYTSTSLAKEEGSIPKSGRFNSILEYKNVSFGYDKDGAVLKDVSFSLKCGETLGIIGGTGSGKTTLINLIPRFYDVKSGKIIYKGVDIHKYPVSALRKEITVIAQEAAIFSGSVKENIRFGSSASDEDVIRAAKIAQAHDFIENIPGGYDGTIEQNGRNLSGGQKQRLSIARGIARNSEIIIFDDSFSALDYITESKLREALTELKSTKIIISQRASSIVYADKILVLYKGEVAGAGTHKELLESCRVYKDIYDSQNI